MNTVFNKKVISIKIDKYIDISGCNDDFTGSHAWDEENGLELEPNKSLDYTFKFKIVDHQKFFLAQIKYGL